MKKIVIILLGLIFFLFGNQLFATTLSKDSKLYVSGKTIGLKLKTKVLVVGMFGISQDGRVETPWKDLIREGDYIIEYNNQSITSTKSLLDTLSLSYGSSSKMKILRNNKEEEFMISPSLKDGKYSLGLYVKDFIEGIGTMTYIIPQTLEFASLGHEMSENSQNNGNIYEASVEKIIKPRANIAGEKRAKSLEEIGTITNANDYGVYGVLSEKNEDYLLMNFKMQDEIKKGPAKILTSIEGNKVEFFDILIKNCYKQKEIDSKSMEIEIVDKRLLEATGGIIQGMSGSPIIQDGKLCGAVTHVLLKNPKIGYGLYVENMLKSQGVEIN